MVPEVEAPEGSGLATVALGAEGGLGFVPEVEGVGDECGLLVVGEPLESGLVEGLEVVQALEEQCWPEELVRWLDLEVLIWELLSSCTEILALCLLLQSGICRCLQFRKLSTIVSP